jgi:transcriptional regulator with XRE-family HTH domain
MGLKANFAKNLRRLRTLKGLSQEDVALEADLNRTYVSDLERQVYVPTLDVVDKVAMALNVDPLELLRSFNARQRETDFPLGRKRR